MPKLLAIVFLFSISQLFGQTDTLKLYYDVDKSELTVSHKQKLNAYFAEINSSEIKSIEVYGHTDTTASISYNKILSSKRSDNVTKYIEALIKIKPAENYFGESKSRFPKDMQIDRRVDIIIKRESIEETVTTDIRDFYKISTLKTQGFCVNNNRDTVLRCQKGTIIYIKSNSFSLNGKNLKTDECITFQVKEAFLNSEMILENLSTTSNGQILETQGMIYTNALLNNDSLGLTRDIIIIKPTDKIVENVKVFDGARDPHSDVINWSLANNSVLRNFKLSDVLDCPPVLKPNPCGTYYDIGHNKRLARIDLNDECIRWLLGGKMSDCMVCKTFFCRILRIPKGIKGTFNKKQKEENKLIRKCAREARKYKKNSRKMRRKSGGRLDVFIDRMIERRTRELKSKKELTQEEKEALEILEEISKSDRKITQNKIEINVKYRCEELDSLFKTYGVSNTKELIYALNKPLMEEFNVSTMEDLMTELPKANLNNIRLAYMNKSISYDDFKFYIFNSTTLGWKNLDVFADLSQDKIADIKINLKPEKYLDCKLVFRERKFVLPAEIENQKFVFKGIPESENAFLVALKYSNGIPMLSLHQITVKKDEEYNVDFKEYTLDELTNALKILDFKEE